LVCAAELAKEGYRAVVFEKRDEPGGMLQFALPEHRLSREFVRREIEDIRSLGVEFRCSTTIRSDEDLERLFSEGYGAVYLATGTWRSVRLGLPHCDSEDILDALGWLETAKCSPREAAHRVRGRKVVVIGGGDTALDAATCAKRAGARDVSILYRRSFLEMPASREEVMAAFDEGVHLLLLTQPVDYVIREGKLEGLEVVRNELQAADGSERPRPVPIPGTEHRFPADVVIEAPGLLPEQTVAAFSGVERDHLSRIVVRDAGGATTRPRVYAGGDAVRGASIVVKAVGDGRRAARAIMDQLAAVEGSQP
jgi:NADPH-dependent glutamate synthase beta subunit-like oxidoreductase